MSEGKRKKNNNNSRDCRRPWRFARRPCSCSRRSCWRRRENSDQTPCPKDPGQAALRGKWQVGDSVPERGAHILLSSVDAIFFIALSLTASRMQLFADFPPAFLVKTFPPVSERTTSAGFGYCSLRSRYCCDVAKLHCPVYQANRSMGDVC